MDESNPAFARLTKISPMLAEAVADDPENLRKLARVEALNQVAELKRMELSQGTRVEFLKELNKMGDVYKKATEATTAERFSLTINIPNQPTVVLEASSPAELVGDETDAEE